MKKYEKKMVNYRLALRGIPFLLDEDNHFKCKVLKKIFTLGYSSKML
uniref:Uncharacterized protein n=1 Tax=Rhizophora mucronata TaxID=61149 RepID=A0A2P2NQD6_RHIMU